MEPEQHFETVVNAMIIYDEPDRAAAANAMLSRPALRAGDGLRWTVKPWRLDMLLAPPTADAAFKDAASAQLIVLAVRSQADLSAWLFDWLEQWAGRREVRDAALALWEGDGGRASAAKTAPQLSRFAERHGLGFIIGEVSVAESESAIYAQRLHQREVAVTSTLEHILESEPSGSYRAWGINE